MNYFNFFICMFIAFLWSLHPIFHKFLQKKIDVIIMFILVWLSTSFFMIFYVIYNNKHILHNIKTITKYEVAIFFIIGIISVIANYLYFTTIKQSDSYIVAALTYCSPLFTVFIAYILLNEKISLSSVIGIMFIILGATLLSYN